MTRRPLRWCCGWPRPGTSIPDYAAFDADQMSDIIARTG